MSQSTILVMFDNEPMPDEISSRLLNFSYEDYEKTGKLTLTFDNTDGEIGDAEEFENGTMITFRHGYIDDLSPHLYFTVGEVEGWEVITVSALEIINIFTTEPKARSWVVASITEVVKTIADEHGLKYEVEERTDSSGATLYFDYFQDSVEDMAFLYTLGRKIGFEVWIEDETLFFLPRRYWQTPYDEFTYKGVDGIVKDFIPKVNTVNRRGKFAGGGIDLETKQKFFVEEDGETSKQTYLAKHFWKFDELNNRYKQLQEAILVRVPMDNKAEAESIMAGKFDVEMEDQITADLVLEGSPHLKSRRVIEVLNVGKYSGKYYIKLVTHDDEGGYGSVAKLTRNATFDKGGKYSIENLNEKVNAERSSISEFQKETKGKRKNNFYEDKVGVR